MGNGRANNPPKTIITYNNRERGADFIPAFIEDTAIGVKINVDIRDKGTWSSTLCLFDPSSGHLLALMDASVISTLRTGAAGAVAAKYLSNNDANVVGIIGAGNQGKIQIRALDVVRPVSEIRIYDIIPDVARKYEEEVAKEMNREVRAVNSVEEAVRGAQIVVTCTTSRQPFLEAEWLEEGTLVTAIGASTDPMRELCTSVLEKADKIVVDSKAQALMSIEMTTPIAEGVLRESDIWAELGEVVAGQRPGRQARSERIVFKSTGIGVHDVSTAMIAYKKANERAIGTNITLN